MLVESGRFDVELQEDPSRCTEENLARYDVLVSNWSAWPDVTGRPWGSQAEKAILDFVARGKGLALFHAASATFQDWTEFQTLIGATWDKATTGHGTVHAFPVTPVVTNHPIMTGLPPFWIRDELWHRMGRAGQAEVLATAWSSRDAGGSGADEPVVLVSQRGQGRCFHFVLGHDTGAMRSPAWQTVMRRGVEWAATGHVTLPMASDWPHTLSHALLPDVYASTPQVSSSADRLLIHAGGRAWLDYRHSSVPFKPFVKHLPSPAGDDILRDAPFDHLHHHGLMYAIRVNDVNYWEETPVAGRQVHQQFIGLHHGPDFAGFTESLLWIPTNNSPPSLTETRTLILQRSAATDLNILTWRTRLALPGPTNSPATLTGSHYHGLGMRFPVALDAQGPFLNPTDSEGAVFRGEERLVDAPWCAYPATAGGRSYTIAMFAHPKNPHFPATWFTMSKPFAYLSATQRLHEKPLTVTSKSQHTEQYGVAIWDRHPTKSEIQKTYESWILAPSADRP